VFIRQLPWLKNNNPVHLEKELYLQLVNSLNSVLSHPVDLIDLNRVSGPILKQALCTG
jgi:hypothetical protein